MKPEKTDGDTSKMSYTDVLIEVIKSIKELAIHVWDCETTPLIGKANFIIVIVLIIVIALQLLMEKDVQRSAYALFSVGMMSCMMSSRSLSKFLEKELGLK